MPTYAVNDGTGFLMNYEVVEGILPETTFFIHGNCASSRWWHPMRDIWQSQSQGKLPGHMICADLRGCGQSSAPHDPKEINMHTFAADFISLLKFLNITADSQVHLVGHSTGGMVSGLMLAKQPELFNKAVLLCSVGAHGNIFKRENDPIFTRMKQDQKLVATVLGAIIHNNDPDSDFFNTVIVPDGLLSVQKVGSLIMKALEIEVGAELRRVLNDVLVLHGEFDQLLPVAGSIELAQIFPHARFELLRGCGHSPNIENPSLVARVIENFFFHPH